MRSTASVRCGRRQGSEAAPLLSSRRPLAQSSPPAPRRSRLLPGGKLPALRSAAAHRSPACLRETGERTRPRTGDRDNIQMEVPW
ncbi:hypothetical protein AAFF_G00267450 [Aldrovandia affinis]|uniref:Uncharacterized protein n=1 Tax=Aldrovandia affinis TaxID=143900 RepID=A0AAD7SS88_9TELE|nr:hypothetical protein AAFF_G00267450 [Aldrovandia affinis]